MKTSADINGRAGPGGGAVRSLSRGPALRLLALLLLLPVFGPAGTASAESQAAQPDTGPPTTGLSETGQVEILIKGQEEPVIIRADRIEQDENLDLTIFIGRVSLRRGQEILTADRALWHNRTKVAEAAGSVRLEAPEFRMEAERAAVNLELSLAKIYRGRLFFSRKNYYLTGTVIESLSENKFQASEATATTCDGPTPAWTIQ
ncbi:MAG: hypothetical protein LBV70_03430, partial [Candidatus Adiutrix sp.]|nr:hypothetical protein [Candidatus Adiutrix sp.]